METITIPLKKISWESDRPHGGEGDIGVLAASIKAHGLIHPVAVKEDGKGRYKAVAGRRRLAAARALGFTEIAATVFPEGADAEEIALAENANRLDAHPLDEAERFQKIMQGGKTAEQIARLYARSAAGIRQRVRLMGLADGAKLMFRDGKLTLQGAALLASLPHEDQEKFLKKRGEKGADDWSVHDFVRQAQKLELKLIADGECEKCEKRTRNTEPGLFEYLHNLEDVCFDADCYKSKWEVLIDGAIVESEDGVKGDTDKVILRCLPPFLPAGEKTLEILGVRYEILPPDRYRWSKAGGNDSIENTAWLVLPEDDGSGITAELVSYKKYEPYRRQSASPKREPENLVTKFKLGLLPGMGQAERKGIAAKLDKKYRYGAWKFFDGVKGAVLEEAAGRRLNLKLKNEDNFAGLYLEAEFGFDGGAEIPPEYVWLYDSAFGKGLPLPLSRETQQLFFFLIACKLAGRPFDLPDLGASEKEWKEEENSLFWRFARLSREEYGDIYRRKLEEAARREAAQEAAQPAADDDEGEGDEDDEDEDEEEDE